MICLILERVGIIPEHNILRTNPLRPEVERNSFRRQSFKLLLATSLASNRPPSFEINLVIKGFPFSSCSKPGVLVSGGIATVRLILYGRNSIAKTCAKPIKANFDGE
ncbi:hypothetical protein QR98_0021020 [Sarcoptes scabiei]|uniref:Uncharacterized protein n=1 Tax=Sarcoptes scabiei TaxID=52283 RepID=A0A131ZXT8_SARSC|nr:hypothetical protein QR98_0021020 [Sarcoptes scabiei]